MLSDFEVTKLCAEAMGWTGWRSKHGYWNVTDPAGKTSVCCNHWVPFDPYNGQKTPEPTLSDALCELGYDPLRDDAQAMALVKKFQIVIERESRDTNLFGVTIFPQRPYWASSVHTVRNAPDLNRAICECVAKMQKAKRDE